MSSERVFESATGELAKLRNDFARIPQNRGDLVTATVEAVLPVVSGEVGHSELEGLFGALVLFGDLAEFSRRVSVYTAPDIVHQTAENVRLPGGRNPVKMVGPDQLRTLHDSRTIGLVPLAATDKLRKMRIKSMGLSAVAPTLDALVAAGAENIEGWDPGILDPSNAPRNVGINAYWDSAGEKKATTLERTLYRRFPYGDYRMSAGKVVGSDSEKTAKHDVIDEEVFKNADLVIEVVDWPSRKAGVDISAREFAPHTLMMFIADLNLPIAGLSYPREGNHFNHDLSNNLIDRMAAKDGGIHPLDMVVAMLGEDLPEDHLMDFVLYKFGLKPYWSQLSHSARELAGLSTHLLLAHLAGLEVTGRNYNPMTVPRHLMGTLDNEQWIILNNLKKAVFKAK